MKYSPDPTKDIADIISRLEHCLIRLDALGCTRAAIRIDHAIEELHSGGGCPQEFQPKQERPA